MTNMNTTQNSSDNLPSYILTNIIDRTLSVGGEGPLCGNADHLNCKWCNFLQFLCGVLWLSSLCILIMPLRPTVGGKRHYAFRSPDHYLMAVC